MGRPVQPIRVGSARGGGFAGGTFWLLAAAAVGLCAAAFAIGHGVGRSGERAAPGEAARLEARLAALDAALASEREARAALEQELAELRTLTEGLAEPALADAAHVAAAASPAEAIAADEPPPPTASDPMAAPGLFDLEALVAGCMNRGDAERLRARWERYELDRLVLNDLARREGFFMTPRHRDAHNALDAAFREEIGDDGYEAYLRATGKPNRFAVKALLPSGAGRSAGLEIGDQVVEYAGVRIFAPVELQQLTADGRPGELVTIEVVRGGQPLTLRAPRGPLGIVLEPRRHAPEGGC